ncbi:Homeobox protein knotted-1-like 3 [Abeliophyllum distichum]|uniref:Homeobox protein knotted-1-like 3 n=1 Tax=Abeliophyllum distichum TaxID=126358 RepID=A0ABD1VS83_9LAMI
MLFFRPQFSSTGEGNFLNLQTNSDSPLAACSGPLQVPNNQWLSRSILQRNVSDVREDVQVSNDSMIAAAISHESADVNNNNNHNHITNDNNELTESGGVAASEGVVNWHNARHKAEILSHPLYEQLLSGVVCGGVGVKPFFF